MMIAITKELNQGETRVAATPATVKEYIKAGLTVKLESGAGDDALFIDSGNKNIDEVMQLLLESVDRTKIYA